MSNNLLFGNNRKCLMGFAIICIMYCHNSISIGSAWALSKQIAQFGVDLFFFLSGYGLCQSYMNNPKGFYRRRIIRIFPTYLLIILPYMCFLIIRHTPISTVIWEFSLISYYTDGVLTEWYIASILLLYLLFPVLFKLIQRKMVFYLLCIIAFGIALYVSYGTLGCPENISIVSGTLIVRIPIFITGIYFRINDNAKNRNRTIVHILILIATLLCIIICRYKIEKYWTIMRVLFYPLTISTSIILSQILNSINNTYKKPLILFGSITLELYLIHEKALSLITTVMSHAIGIAILEKLEWTIFINIIAVIISVIISLVYSRIIKNVINHCIKKETSWKYKAS